MSESSNGFEKGGSWRRFVVKIGEKLGFQVGGICGGETLGD